MQPDHKAPHAHDAALAATGDTLPAALPDATARASTALQYAALLCVLVMLASLFGVWTRLAGQLAVFWPANALLLGLLIRFPRFDTPAGWIGATVGYLLGGQIAGDAPVTNILLTMGNLFSVGVGYTLLSRRNLQERRLARPSAILHMLWITLAASAAAGVAGGVLAATALGGDAFQSALSWFISEFINFIIILPALLTIPGAAPRTVPRQWRGHQERVQQLLRAAPFACLLLSLLLALLVGGPGAMAFPLPALLWCGMTHGVFRTSVLALLTTTWTLLAISRGYLDIATTLDSGLPLNSIRLGVALIAMSPIAVASAMSAHNSLLARLRHMAEHDPMTGTMNRRAFAEHATRTLRALHLADAPAGLLILDIDRFKSVNDTHGHAAGDLVIAHVAECLRRHLPHGPKILGRLGGEEFAVLLPHCDLAQTQRLAETMRQACAGGEVGVAGGQKVQVTASIGAAVATPAVEQLDRYLHAADHALYQAKREGRDRVVVRPLGHATGPAPL
jgi:diguanylate cyclase (GGDEF)-like protein